MKLFTKQIISRNNFLSYMSVLWKKNLYIANSFKYDSWVGQSVGRWSAGPWVGELVIGGRLAGVWWLMGWWSVDLLKPVYFSSFCLTNAFKVLTSRIQSTFFAYWFFWPQLFPHLEHLALFQIFTRTQSIKIKSIILSSYIFFCKYITLSRT